MLVRMLGFAAAGAMALAACANGDGGSSQDASDKAGAAVAIGETGGMCGGIAGFPCASEGDYCMMAPGECVQIADVAGVCTVKPEMCTMDYRPVCGCDGETYSNACVAASKGVSVASEGECPPSE